MQKAPFHNKPILINFPGPSKDSALDHDCINSVAALLHHTAVLFNTSVGWQVGIYGAPKLAGDQHRRFIDLSPSPSSPSSKSLSDPSFKCQPFLRHCWNTLFIWTVGEEEASYQVIGSNQLGQAGLGTPDLAHHDLETEDHRTMPSRRIVEGNGRLQGSVKDVATGSEHTLASLQDKDGHWSVLAWGWNEHGNLGTGALDNRDRPTLVWSCKDANFDEVRVFAGNGTSFITS